jgi:antitoxin ParD1/3/4
MSNVEKRTISLPHEHAAFIDAQVASGAFASASEVVRAGLRALQERDAAVERWLRTEVVATYDEMKAHPERGIRADQVMNRLRARAAARQKVAAQE